MLYPKEGQPGFIQKIFGKSVAKTPEPTELQRQYKSSTSYRVAAYNPYQMKKALALGPVSVLINADFWNVMLYRKGIIDTADCGPGVTHAVIAVGYGKDPETKKEYFIIRNSWGKGWGEDGYARIAADQSKLKEGICGILQYGAIAFVEQEHVPAE